MIVIQEAAIGKRFQTNDQENSKVILSQTMTNGLNHKEHAEHKLKSLF